MFIITKRSHNQHTELFNTSDDDAYLRVSVRCSSIVRATRRSSRMLQSFMVGCSLNAVGSLAPAADTSGRPVGAGDSTASERLDKMADRGACCCSWRCTVHYHAATHKPAAVTAEATLCRAPPALFPTDLPTSRNAVIADREDNVKDLTRIALHNQSRVATQQGREEGYRSHPLRTGNARRMFGSISMSGDEGTRHCRRTAPAPSSSIQLRQLSLMLPLSATACSLT